MIISVHLPKTAGTSFFDALNTAFDGKVLRDYQDFPLHQTIHDRTYKAFADALFMEDVLNDKHAEMQCIHGHFMPVKYALLPEHKTDFITWMRHPVNRLVSHYHHWVNTYNEHSPSLQKRVVEENWTLDDFACSLEMKNVYAQFLFSFPITRFKFIGITEYYSQDLNWLRENLLGQDIQESQLNRRKTDYSIDPKLKDEIETLHIEDMDLYEHALKMREKRVWV